MKKNNLIKLAYDDYKNDIHVETFTNTLTLESSTDSGTYIAAVRFGGYPESVRAMSDAMYGGGQIQLKLDNKTHFLKSYTKQYRRELTHDGIYAEATLMVNDGETINHDNDSTENEKKRPRKCYLFCEHDNSDRLFEEIDKKTAVPLIPEFKDYVLSELQARKILTKLQIITCTDIFDSWVLTLTENEQNMIDVVNDGLKSGAISIPNDNGAIFPEINGVTGYLNEFGVKIAERIRNQFEPLFDPATETVSAEILAVNENIKKNTGYSLYDAQLAVAEAHKRALQKQKSTMCIAECGSGKTKIGITALHAYQQRKSFNVVLCPSHMTKKWMREIEESLPNTFAAIVTSITELNRVYNAYTQDNKTCYVVINKEKARDGYMKRPAAMWNYRKKAFLCSDCYEPVMMEVIDCGSKYEIKADAFFFQKQNKKNNKCSNCGNSLWTMLVAEQQSEWVKISEYGFVHRMWANEHLKSIKKPGIYEVVEAIADNPNGTFHNAGAYNRFPLSTYIKRKMKGKIDGLIIDELHNYNVRPDRAICEAT